MRRDRRPSPTGTGLRANAELSCHLGGSLGASLAKECVALCKTRVSQDGRPCCPLPRRQRLLSGHRGAGCRATRWVGRRHSGGRWTDPELATREAVLPWSGGGCVRGPPRHPPERRSSTSTDTVGAAEAAVRAPHGRLVAQHALIRPSLPATLTTWTSCGESGGRTVGSWLTALDNSPAGPPEAG